MRHKVRVCVAVFALLRIGLWTIVPDDPPPPPHWPREFDTPPIIEGNRAQCVLEDSVLIEPGGFCTKEGWDPGE